MLDINERAHRKAIETYNSLAEEVMARPGATELPYDLRIKPEEVPAPYKSRAAELPSDVTEEEVTAAMSKHGLTRAEVLERYKKIEEGKRRARP